MIADELKLILDEHPLTLLYFSTPTCGVCQVLRPQVEALLQDEAPWHFQYVNTEESREIAGQHLIFAVPTILLMADGREITRLSRHFGMHELEQPVRRYAELFRQSDS
ncbi:MAG: thioredoxin family protein [FCB group bacterium]|nr:thioredoxin family protein [FCB group bacterium]MBL7123142.1 thioredoxin family protein [Candidatus Neomarinimicrobiota bacterium]